MKATALPQKEVETTVVDDADVEVVE